MTCGNCNLCDTRTYCKPLRDGRMKVYDGARFTSDCFDCAIHLSLDTYSTCSFDCLYCQPADAPIWMADGTWSPVGEVTPGDAVIGFSRTSTNNRHFAYSTVEAVFRREAPLVRVLLRSGREVRCTPDHHWYTGRIEQRYEYAPARVGRPLVFIAAPFKVRAETEDYKIGYLRGIVEGDGCTTDREYVGGPHTVHVRGREYHYESRKLHVRNVRLAMQDVLALSRFSAYCRSFGLNPHDGEAVGLPCVRVYGAEALRLLVGTEGVPSSEEYWRGWLAGIFDAEGSVSDTLRIAQSPEVNPETFARIGAVLRAFEFDVEEEEKGWRVRGGRAEVLRFWSLAQPALWRKVEAVIFDRRLLGEYDDVVAIEPAGTAEVVSLRTSTHNYIGQGYASRNCFSNYLIRNPELKAKTGSANLGAMSPQQVESILDLDRTGGGNGMHDVMRATIRDPRGGRRVIQWGALGDPFDNIERHRQVGRAYIPLFQKYGQPVRVSTKGGLLLQEKVYLDLLAVRPEIFWFAFSTITIDDEVLEAVDRRAPNATQRLKAMKLLTDLGCRASLRLRPILRNVSDRTPRYPMAWRDLLRRSRDAGAEAVSMEFVFVPGTMKPGVRTRWEEIERITGYPYRRFYKNTSDRFGACLRSSRWWKEELTFAIRDEAHRLGMVFSISDPHWKEWNDTGCCCGMKPDDPVFGKWETKQACQALLDARLAKEAGKERLLRYDDVVPEWARKTVARHLLCVTGPKGAATAAQMSFADFHHRHIWNDPNSTRGPRIYFGGVLEVAGKDENGDLVYRYIGSERKREAYGWSVPSVEQPDAGAS